MDDSAAVSRIAGVATLFLAATQSFHIPSGVISNLRAILDVSVCCAGPVIKTCVCRRGCRLLQRLLLFLDEIFYEIVAFEFIGSRIAETIFRMMSPMAAKCLIENSNTVPLEFLIPGC